MSLQDLLVNALGGVLPDGLQQLASLSGCRACRRCGHGTVGKLKHGPIGCHQCGTTQAQGGSGGCLQRSGPCPCEWHRRHDEVVLARACAAPEALPASSAVRSAWRVYEGTALDRLNVTWRRPDIDSVAELLSAQCGHKRHDTVTYLLPALLVRDLLHNDGPEAQFMVAAVTGECVVGLSEADGGQPSKVLAVLEWAAIPGREVCETLLRMSKALPRAKRSVTKRLALRCCPALVEEYCRAELAKKAGSSTLRARLKTREHWLSEAHALCCEAWGLPSLPVEIVADIEGRVASWSGGKRAKKRRTLSAPFDAQLASQ